MLEACGDVTDMNILDCGCGEGRFCRMLAGRGAKYVLGIDLCDAMIDAAKNWQEEITSTLEEIGSRRRRLHHATSITKHGRCHS